MKNILIVLLLIGFIFGASYFKDISILNNIEWNYANTYNYFSYLNATDDNFTFSNVSEYSTDFISTGLEINQTDATGSVAYIYNASNISATELIILDGNFISSMDINLTESLNTGNTSYHGFLFTFNNVTNDTGNVSCGIYTDYNISYLQFNGKSTTESLELINTTNGTISYTLNPNTYAMTCSYDNKTLSGYLNKNYRSSDYVRLTINNEITSGNYSVVYTNLNVTYIDNLPKIKFTYNKGDTYFGNGLGDKNVAGKFIFGKEYVAGVETITGGQTQFHQNVVLNSSYNYTFDNGATIGVNSTCVIITSPNGSGVYSVCDT